MYKLWKRDTFINENIPFTFNTDIIEYDMKEAGFSLSKDFKLLDKHTIQRLEKISKERRTIALGKIQNTNKEYKESLKIAFQEARRMFFEANRIEQTDIISIKKDAIFTTKRCDEQKFGNCINFRPKHFYTSYINLGKNLEFYYNPDELSVKGIGDEKLGYHEEYMLKFIKLFIKKMETEDPETVIGFTKRFINKYKRRELEVGYYRTLDHRSMYMMNDGSGELYENYFEEDKWDLDISYNYFSILLKLVQIPL